MGTSALTIIYLFGYIFGMLDEELAVVQTLEDLYVRRGAEGLLPKRFTAM